MSEISEDIQKLVEQNGDKVGLDTQECVIWKLKHPNCFGCPSELGCGKVVHIMLLMMIPMTYKPNSFDDFSKMHQRISELQVQVLKTDNLETLKKIPTT